MNLQPVHKYVQERIVRKGRGKEHATTTHLIKIHVFAHVVMLLKLARMMFVPILNGRASGACMILLLAVVLQNHLGHQLKQSRKRLVTLTVRIFSCKQNWCRGQADS